MSQDEWDEVMASQEFRNARQEWETRNRGKSPRDPSFEDPAATANCERCLDTSELPNGNVCPDCCPHDDRDGMWCLVCNTDISEHVISQAEFRADCEANR